ncbi:Epoxide hydrolase a [Thalictrum thalictroides]|uniref:soluble epoxide hydrolase n=1 Tax=Thalictrum thalictroides TaxID=46969 RepID=A0A7J6WW42_THATH|nr:Epoxide hydrolase a [Thalictrum thalictroides]
MEEIEHRIVQVNGIKMHIAEKGEGPVVLLLHGFPELWYSWRHQIVSLASSGYKAVAPDMRGYGDTDEPPSLHSYTSLHIVGDLIALIDLLGVDQVFVVGHDWGANIAWHLCLFRPDKVKALVNLSVHYFPRNPMLKPIQIIRAVYGDDFYVLRFQEPGEIEAEFARVGAETVIKKFLTLRDPGPLMIPKATGFGISPNSPITLPSWLTQKDVDYYAGKFEEKGFTGGLNYYRAFDLNWELTAAWTNAQLNVPVKFIVGDLDPSYHVPGAKEYIHGDAFKRDVPLLEEVIVMEGVAHFTQQESPTKVSKHILDFIQKF